MKLPWGNAVYAAFIMLFLLPAQQIRSAFDANDGQKGLALEAIERLTPDLTTPPVLFAIRNFSGQADLFSAADEGQLNNISAWQIQILDQGGRKVAFIQGRNRPPSAVIPWAGISGEGEPLPDGFYSAILVWADFNKQVYSTPKTSVNLFTPKDIRNLTGKKLRLNYTDEGLVVSIAEGIIFKPGQCTANADAAPVLREICQFLKSYSGNRIAVRGHTHFGATAKTATFLAREMASLVYQHLVNSGLDTTRLTYTGLGSGSAAAKTITEARGPEDGRVDVVILKTDN
jgi:outer membrane protein OmpA-like peptidoglycan-associated protein